MAIYFVSVSDKENTGTYTTAVEVTGRIETLEDFQSFREQLISTIKAEHLSIKDPILTSISLL
jgi:hypothetical protein